MPWQITLISQRYLAQRWQCFALQHLFKSLQMPPALEKRLWFWCCLTQPWSRPHLGSYRGVCVHFTSTRGKPAYIKQDPFSVNSCLFLQFDPHNCPQFYFLQWKITGNNTVIFSYMSYRLLSSARKLLLTSVPSSLVCLSAVEMSMPHSFPAKSIRENLAYKIFFLLENGVEGSLALGGLNVGRGLAWHASWHLHTGDSFLTAPSFGSFSHAFIHFFHFTGSYNS